MTWDLFRELLQGTFTAIGFFWTIRVAIPEALRRLIDKYDKRPTETETK